MVDAKTIMVVLSVVITLFIGIWVVSSVSSSVVLPTFTQSNEAVTIATNWTDVALAKSPAITVLSVYNDTAHTCALPAANWVQTGQNFKIKTNSTVGSLATCPDGTTTGNYTVGDWIVTYTYQNSAGNSTFTTVGNTVWNAFNLLAVVLIVLAASTILAYFGFGAKD